jgi:hypothetical protein
MKTPAKRGLFYALVLGSACAIVGIVAACGSSNGSVFNSGGPDGATSGSSGSSSFGPIAVSDGGGSSSSGNVQTLVVDPPTASLVITDKTQPPTQKFTAKDVGGNPVSATWTLDDYTAATVDATGLFTAKGTVAATVKVIATSGGAQGSATVDLTVKLQQSLNDVILPDGTQIKQDSASISAANKTALTTTTPVDEGAGGTKLTYPYDKTVMPRGLLAPVPQFTAGVHPPEDFKVMLDATGFHWEGLGHVPVSLQAAIPQDAWDGAFLSAQPDATTQERIVTLSVIKASGGVAYGPATAHIIVAPASLTGVIYYSSYSQNQLMNDAGGGGTDFGLWSVHPGTVTPPTHLNTGCVICHSVSANGKTLTTGSDPGDPGPSGVYDTNGVTLTQLSKAPAGLGGDTRNLSWATISPDGEYVLRSQNNFWGGSTLLAWTKPATANPTQALSTTVPVTGATSNMYVPAFSPDGTKLVFVNADGASASHSVGLVDVKTDPTTGVALSSFTTIYDSKSAGNPTPNMHTRVPMFLPDSKGIVFQQTPDSEFSGFNGMLPNWKGAENSYTTGKLFALRPGTDGKYVNVEMTNANTGSVAAFSTANYEPKPLPVQAGGYYWVVFTSIRNDGLQGNPIKKLWITAISPGVDPTADPSHPPFLITNQSIIPTQRCERGYWSVDPCHDDGASCKTGDDCCNGFCRPSVDGDPTSPYVCKTPTTIACANDGDRCRAGHSEDCCGAATGEQCIGSLNGFGTCGVPAPR